MKTGERVRFHKAESAFFVLVALVLGAGVLNLHAYGVLHDTSAPIAAVISDERIYVAQLLFASGVLLATGIIFGTFLIYPLIRGQVRVEGTLRAMTETLSQRSETLQQAALTDGLTGAQNRRYFDDALPEYLGEFARINKPVGLMVLDLDHFKMVNDNHGHDVGDRVLREVANCLKDMTRHHDVVARLGGEEFAVVAPNMTPELLFKLAERIRKAIAAMTIMSGNVRLKVTASVGLAIWDGEEDAESFYRRADRMLYQAKRMGRNRVCA